jgi:DNA-binding XRE family transcriptional regulator
VVNEEDLPSDPAILRKEINALIDKMTHRGSLLFTLWLVTNIDKELPPIDELKKLHQTFIRVVDAFRRKQDVAAEDWKMMFRWVGTIGNVPNVSRHLASTVKFYREKAGMTRFQLARKVGISMRTMLKLERGGIKDMSLPRLYQLTGALNCDAGEFMDRIYRLEKEAEKDG